jgi:tetratricopeptide (TPR) repeat protein
MKNKYFILLILFIGLLFSPSVRSDNGQKDSNAKANLSIDAVELAIAHNKQGNVYLESGYPLHAINEYKIGIMLNPNSTMSATLYNNLGRAYETVRAYELAIMSYQHAIKINPDFSVYYKNLVNAYKVKKSLKQARINYEKIVKINPLDAQAYFTLGLIYYMQGNKAESDEAFNKVITLEPNIDLSNAARKYLSDGIQ